MTTVLVECPTCYSKDIEGNIIDGGVDDVGREMSCNNCFSEWYVEYNPGEWDIHDEGIRPIPDPYRHVVRVKHISI